MNNIPISKWVQIDYSPLPIGLSEMSIIRCNRCGYFSHPNVFRYKKNNIDFGRLELPKKCLQCNAIMERNNI